MTNNLKHFLPEDCEPYGVEAQNADGFVLHLVSLDPIAVRDAVLTIALRRTRPPKVPLSWWKTCAASSTNRLRLSRELLS